MASSKQSIFGIALLPGLFFTVLVVAIDFFDGLAAWERLSIDWRFRSVPRLRRPMSESIVHVDIDDGALDIIGRWPWPRGVLADVVDELGKAGARTVAVDLLLTEESERERNRSTERDTRAVDLDEMPEDDRLLAEAFSRVRSVVPVQVHEGSLFDPVWLTPEGAEEMVRLLRVLGQDVRLDLETALDEAAVTGTRRARFASRQILFRRAATWTTAQTLSDEDLVSFDDFQRRVVPRLNQFTGRYPERKLVASVWRQVRAWRSAGRFLLENEGTPGTFRDNATLPAFVENSQGVGFVNVEEQKHPDGVIREIALGLPANGGTAIQFGLAAAAAHLGLTTKDITISDDRLTFGHLEMPLRDGRLWVNWPTSETEPRWQGFLRQRVIDPESMGHLSIRELVELADARRDLELERKDHAGVVALILQFIEAEFQPGEELSPDNLQKAREEAEFVIDDLAEAEGEEEEGEEEEDDETYLQHVMACKAFVEREKALQEGRELITTVETTLAKKVSGKLVFLGWTATGALADFIPTAIESRTPGVIVHAAVANMVLTGTALNFAPQWSRPLLILLIGLLCTLATIRASALRSAIVALGAIVAYVAIVGIWLFNRDIVFPLTAPLTAGGLAWVSCTAIQSALSQRDRRRIMRQFKARVSQQLVEHLIEDPKAVTVSGEYREATIIFCDLAGFTTVSEKLGGAATVHTLNQYMVALTTVLTEEDAYVNKFLGDGLMAFWSAFVPDGEQRVKACRAAVKCQEAVMKLNDDPSMAEVPSLRLRIGIATGKVIVGDCGAPPELHDYTAIGDAVNLSARLESANKQFGTQTMIDGLTREGIGEERVLFRSLGKIVVVGQSKPVDVFEVVPPGTSPGFLSVSEAVVEAYSGGRWDECLDGIEKLEEMVGPSKFQETYRDAVDLARGTEEFDGVLRLQEK